MSHKETLKSDKINFEKRKFHSSKEPVDMSDVDIEFRSISKSLFRENCLYSLLFVRIFIILQHLWLSNY